jgi:hypothetical protein
MLAPEVSTVEIIFVRFGRMPTAVRDASLVTLKNRGIAINAYKSAFTSATMNTAAANGALVAPGVTGAETLIQARVGCEACVAIDAFNAAAAGQTTDPNISRYPANPSAGGAASLTGSS